MLSERQLQAALQILQDRMRGVTNGYLARMGEHLRDLGSLRASDVNRLMQMQRMNYNIEAAKREIARAAEMSIADVERIFLATAESDARFAQSIFASDHALSVKGNNPLERILKAQLRITAQEMANLSRTTILSGGYRSAIDVAISAVQSGVADYNSAIRSALRQAGAEGLRVQYPNSGLTRRLDSAVRQNVLDGVHAINQDVLRQVGKDFRADGVELDAHALCAEDHLPYQGRQFSNEEFERLQNNLDRKIGDWNCKHTAHPILLGISKPAYSDAELEAFRQNSRELVEIDGRTLTRYEWSQQQRRLETQVRYQKDIATVAKASGDDVLRREAQARINAITAQYERISDKTGLYIQRERMGVSGFRRVKTQAEIASSKLSGTITADGLRVNVSEHAAKRIITRGVSTEDLRDCLTRPLGVGKIKYDEFGRPSIQYIGEKATAAVNPETGEIATAWPTGSKRAEKLKKAKEDAGQ